jgi:hypothetical protein
MAPEQSLVVKVCATVTPSAQNTALLEYPSAGFLHSPNAPVMVSTGSPEQSLVAYTF